MAKKSKVKSLGCDATCSPGQYTPTVYFDFDEDETKILDGLKIGDTVYVVVKGTVSSVSKSERLDSETKEKTLTGTLRLDNPDYEVTSKSVWAELADDSGD